MYRCSPFAGSRLVSEWMARSEAEDLRVKLLVEHGLPTEVQEEIEEGV